MESKLNFVVKVILKKIRLWDAIMYSNLYQKYKYPKKFKKQKEEEKFYKFFLKSHPAKNDLIFDVGANIGSKSKIFSKLAKNIIAFEPSPKLFSFLQTKFRNTNVKVYNYALGTNVSKSFLYIVEENEAYNSLKKKHIITTVSSRGIATLDSVKKEKIKIEKLENFITKFGIPKYIKIDVEGYEYEVLKGMETVVPLLSFEVNLPEFLNESLKAIAYLQNISSNKYLFNFSSSTNSFLENEFLSAEKAKFFLQKTDLSYLEIYAYLS